MKKSLVAVAAMMIAFAVGPPVALATTHDNAEVVVVGQPALGMMQSVDATLASSDRGIPLIDEGIKHSLGSPPMLAKDVPRLVANTDNAARQAKGKGYTVPIMKTANLWSVTGHLASTVPRSPVLSAKVRGPGSGGMIRSSST